MFGKERPEGFQWQHRLILAANRPLCCTTHHVVGFIFSVNRQYPSPIMSSTVFNIPSLLGHFVLYGAIAVAKICDKRNSRIETIPHCLRQSDAGLISCDRSARWALGTLRLLYNIAAMTCHQLRTLFRKPDYNDEITYMNSYRQSCLSSNLNGIDQSLSYAVLVKLVKATFSERYPATTIDHGTFYQRFIPASASKPSNRTPARILLSCLRTCVLYPSL